MARGEPAAAYPQRHLERDSVGEEPPEASASSAQIVSRAFAILAS